MQWNQNVAETRLASMNMDDMPVMQFQPKNCTVESDWFIKYKKLCHEFMMSLTDSVDQLAFMNLSQDDFIALIMGRQMPQNISIRFRVPLIWGGKLEIDNLFLCKTFPHCYNLDRFIIEQSGNEIVWLPNPAKKVYVPAHMTGGGDGGNATEDRLSQIAAQLANNRSME